MMFWTIVKKDESKLLLNRPYKDCKEDLAKEANYRCVYCCIHESRFGGFRNFHIEHYKPKSIFVDLTDDYGNLLYACSICNCFKGDDWPNEPNKDFVNAFYPNPLIVDYSTYIDIDSYSGKISSHKPALKYIIEKLYLNRPQLLNERKFSILLKKLNEIYLELENLINQLIESSINGNSSAKELLRDAFTSLIELGKLQVNLQEIRPYTKGQISK